MQGADIYTKEVNSTHLHRASKSSNLMKSVWDGFKAMQDLQQADGLQGARDNLNWICVPVWDSCDWSEHATFCKWSYSEVG